MNEFSPTLIRESRVKRSLRYIVTWFDAYAGKAPEADDAKDGVQLVRVVPFIALHVLCLAVFMVGFSWTALAFCVAFYLVRMFAITGFYHRYFAHRSFKTTRFMQFLFALLGNSAAQRGPLWWAAHHRFHHRYSDQEDDAHSPKVHSFLWSHMLWFTSKKNLPTKFPLIRDLMRFPELVFLDRFDIVAPFALGSLVFGTGMALEHFVPGLGTNGMQLFIWGFVLSTVVLYHGTFSINSLAHLIGRQRFKTGDASRNSLILALVTLGEGWHNNHHHYPLSTRQGFYWWEIDITYYVLRFLSLFGIVWDLKPVPKRIFSEE